MGIGFRLKKIAKHACHAHVPSALTAAAKGIRLPSMMSTELLIAWRYIKSKRREKFISAMAFFSLMGVALGVATLIIVTSVMNGFRLEFTERVIGFNGHLALHPVRNSGNYASAVEEVLSIRGVRQAIPVVERQALISNGRTVRGSMTYGLRPQDLVRKPLIADNLTRGSLNDFIGDDVIVIGEALAVRARLSIGDRITVMAPEMDETGFGHMPRKKTFRLVATFSSGMYEYDNSVSYIPLGMAQKLFKTPDFITGISVFVDNPMWLSAIREEILQKFSDNFQITDWQTSNSSFMKAIEIERNVMFLILTLITLVASFNIISCMIMLVRDKEQDVAILRTMGLRRSSIQKVFFVVGASIGVVGTLFGAILGLLFSLNIQKIQMALETLLHTRIFSPEVYFLTQLPSVLRPLDVIVTVAVSLLLSCLATMYPARKAAGLNPTEILRYA
ncbi:MAG: lipoprotein-releasing ABC transporter permease subunit [Holosporaceae bacterium]|nr:lipoprotein-releasing ABC transporter permease subunit [Holosporaceae bacterium]